MLKRIAFPDYTPDAPVNVTSAANLVALPQGYRPSRAISPVTVALTGFLGGGAFNRSGNQCLLGGTATNLYRYSAGAWVSVLGTLSASVWRFTQFGDNVIAANGSAPVNYVISTGTAAALGGSPPVADMVATVRDQVFLAGDPSSRDTLTISGYNDTTNWSGGTNQQLTVSFPSGGDIMGLCGGETGLILQQRSITRAIYTGGVTVWQFDEISRDVGCMAKGSVAQAGSLVFFLSEQGFKICDRNEVFPIGMESVDRTFFESYSRVDIVDNIKAAVDPRATTVCWSMPGTPGKVWCYNWVLKKWSAPMETSVKMIFQGFTQGVSLEGLDALYPSGLDSIPVSLDSTMFAGGNPLLFLVDATGVVGTLTGDIVSAHLSLDPQEIEPGRRVRIQGARVVGDVTSGTVTLDCRARAGDTANTTVSGAIRDNGRVPIRANGRHIGVRVDIPAHQWSYAQGIDVEYSVEGKR